MTIGTAIMKTPPAKQGKQPPDSIAAAASGEGAFFVAVDLVGAPGSFLPRAESVVLTSARFGLDGDLPSGRKINSRTPPVITKTKARAPATATFRRHLRMKSMRLAVTGTDASSPAEQVAFHSAKVGTAIDPLHLGHLRVLLLLAICFQLREQL